MNLKKLLTGNTEQLLTAKDYRIASQLRIHAGKMLAFTTPLVALGAVTNSPALAIPALYIPAALLIPHINYLLLKTVPTDKQSGLSMIKTLLFNPMIGIILLIFGGAIYEALFAHTTQYQEQAWATSSAGQFQSGHYWDLVLFGIAMTGVCAWLSYTLMRGKRTQAMQRIAQHLAAQEADNA